MKYGVRPTNPLEWLALKAGKVPLPILDVLVGPLQAQALMAAVRCGLFRELHDGPRAIHELAGGCGVDAECLGLVARVVRSMGYLELHDGRFELSALGERHFGRHAAESYVDFVAYGPPQYAMMERTFEVLTSGAGIDFHQTQTSDEWQLYQRAMAENASSFAWFVAEHCPVPHGARTCLDIAGAHGIVGAALAKNHPGMEVVVLDRPEALSTAKAEAAERGLSVSFRAGDLLHDELGDAIDVVLLCNILHHFTAEVNRGVLDRVFKALRDTGTVAIFDVDTALTANGTEAISDALALYFRITSTSTCFGARDYERWLTDSGFREVRSVRSIKMPGRVLVVARK